MRIPHPIWALTLARLREFVRQPESLFWVYLFPILMVVVLGIAFRHQPVEQIQVDVVDPARPSGLLESLAADPLFQARQVTEAEGRDRLRAGKTSLVVLAGPDESVDVQYLFDPQRPGSQTARQAVDRRLQQSAGRQDVLTAADVVFDEPGGRYVDFLVPGLLGMSLMGGGLWGVGFAIVDMRIRKLLKRFMATPMRRTHFLLAMMSSRLIFMWPQIIVLLVFSYLFFDVRIFGNLWALGLVILLGAIEFGGIGLLVAARARTLETVSGLMNLVMLPMWTLSGIFFSYERFPEIVQPLIRWLPLTPVIDALRGLMMEGVPLASLGPELAIMGFWSVVPFAIALAIFRWTD